MSDEDSKRDAREQKYKADAEPAQGLAVAVENTPPRECDSANLPPGDCGLHSPEGVAIVGDDSPQAKREQPVSTGQSKIEEAAEQPEPPVPRSVVLHAAQRLPNCKITGIDYQASVADAVSRFAPHEISGSGIDRERTNVDFDLHWNPEKFEISCHPEQAGEFEIDLYVDLIRRERHVIPFKLTVNADPKTLWKNIPSDQSGVYAKPDSDRTFLACGEKLSIVAASQRGRSHAQEGRPRDDDFIADYNADSECAILIVADGAGSAKFSREGSRLATRTALEKVKAAIAGSFWTGLIPVIGKWANEKDVQAEKTIKKALYVLIHCRHYNRR